VRRLGDARDPATVTSRGPRQARLDGFDLHANVWVSANDRAGVERLCRYVLRPPFAQERLRLRGDGRVALELKRAWHDGTRELVFEPLEFLERLAAMTPRPETNLLICHGVLYHEGGTHGRSDRCRRSFMLPVLREHGYRVLEASNGIAALELLEAEKDLRLLFTDVGLPGGRNGRQLADEARRRRPDLLVLFTTGYTRNAIIHQGRLDPGAELIGKPFTYATLVAKIQRLLRRAA
jgi:CheY-like chemotaxis protein